MRHEPLKERARGRWQGILPALGVSAKALKNKHGPCPMCGGKDRFRFDDRNGSGSWICNQCGSGDGIELVKRMHQCEFKPAAELIEQHIGSAPIISRGKPAEAAPDLAAMWERARPITADDAAGKYLTRRVGLPSFPATLRFAADERYAEQGKRATWHPCMLAKVDPSDAAAQAGERPALHRTFLNDLGGKADVSSPRKMLGAMPTGAAVRLMQHEEVLGIAEGIETALSAWRVHQVPVWAALTEGLLSEWEPPAGVSTVMVFGDRDASFAGQAASYTLARRLKAKGLTVFVELPPRIGWDWNDVWLDQRRAAA